MRYELYNNKIHEEKSYRVSPNVRSCITGCRSQFRLREKIVRAEAYKVRSVTDCYSQIIIGGKIKYGSYSKSYVECRDSVLDRANEW